MSEEDKLFRKIRNIGITAAAAVFVVFPVLFGAWYTVPEGHVGIVKQFGKAIEQTDPGFHLKFPFVQSVENMEVRQRKSVEEMSAATENQLPITAIVSVNWTVQKESAMDIFIKYGGLEQFESRILDPKLRQVAKAELSKFRADELIRERENARTAIQNELVEVVAGLPIIIDSPQIENINLPPQYMEAVMAKERAREDAEREKNVLEKQRLEALQKVNTADAEKQAAEKTADGKAYAIRAEAEARAEAIRMEGEAEADKVRAINEALAANPMLVEYEKAKRWDGAVPKMMTGDGTGFLMNLGNMISGN